MENKNTKIRKVKYKSDSLAGFKLPCYVLEDGTRVISSGGIRDVLKMTGNLDIGKEPTGNRLKQILNQKVVKPFVYREAEPENPNLNLEPIICYRGGTKIHGYEADTLIEILKIFLRVRKDSREKNYMLSDTLEIIADQCEILLGIFAKVGIIALIDEATGYQYERERFELQEILRTHVLKGRLFLKWRETFKLDFYKELFEIYDIPFTPENIRRKPPFIGWLTNELVYKNLPRGKEILAEIKARTPRTKGGNPKKRQHQSLTKKVGRETLIDVIATVRTIAKIAKKDKDKRRKLSTLVKEAYSLEKELPYIDVEAMNDNKDTKFDKIINVALNTTPIKQKDLKAKLEKKRVPKVKK